MYIEWGVHVIKGTMMNLWNENHTTKAGDREYDISVQNRFDVKFFWFDVNFNCVVWVDPASINQLQCLNKLNLYILKVFIKTKYEWHIHLVNDVAAKKCWHLKRDCQGLLALKSMTYVIEQNSDSDYFKLTSNIYTDCVYLNWLYLNLTRDPSKSGSFVWKA